MSGLGIMKRNIFIIILICLLLLAAFLASHFSNEEKKAQKETAATIDSLVQICSDHAKQIESLRTEATSLNNETRKFELLLDSLEGQFVLQARDKKKLIGQIRQIRKKIVECEEKIGDTETSERNFTNEIKELRSELALLHSRFDIPIIFILYSSFQYYGSDPLQDGFFPKELDRIAQINGWQVTCGQIVDRIGKSSKLKYRGLKWAGLKGGCPFEASYFLLEEYNYEPENIDEEKFVEILKEVFRTVQRNFTFCSSHIKKSFHSEGEGLKRIKDTITCLKKNLGIK